MLVDCILVALLASHLKKGFAESAAICPTRARAEKADKSGNTDRRAAYIHAAAQKWRSIHGVAAVIYQKKSILIALLAPGMEQGVCAPKNAKQNKKNDLQKDALATENASDHRKIYLCAIVPVLELGVPFGEGIYQEFLFDPKQAEPTIGMY